MVCLPGGYGETLTAPGPATVVVVTTEGDGVVVVVVVATDDGGVAADVDVLVDAFVCDGVFPQPAITRARPSPAVRIWERCRSITRP